MASGHIMASGMFFKFGTSHHVAADLLALRAPLMPLVRVPWYHNCSSKLCLQVGTCETSWRRISVSGRHGSAIQFCVVFGKLCFFDFWFNISWPVAYLSSSTPGTMLKNWWSVPHSTYPYMQARSRNSLYFRGVALVDCHGLCVALIDSQTRCTVQIGYNRYLQTKKGYARL